MTGAVSSNDRPGDCNHHSPSWDTCDRGCNWPECGCVLGKDGEMHPMPQGARETECEECEYTYGTHAPDCSQHPDYDPTPWCSGCGARRKSDCDCGPLAEND